MLRQTRGPIDLASFGSVKSYGNYAGGVMFGIVYVRILSYISSYFMTGRPKRNTVLNRITVSVKLPLPTTWFKKVSIEIFLAETTIEKPRINSQSHPWTGDLRKMECTHIIPTCIFNWITVELLANILYVILSKYVHKLSESMLRRFGNRYQE